MLKLSKVNHENFQGISRGDIAPVAGMAALWVSMFKQLLYPVLYAYYRTGSDGALTAQGAYSVALVGGTFLILIAHEHLNKLLGAGRWIVAAFGIAGGCGFALRMFCDFSTDTGMALACLGSVLSALYIPVHLAFWVLYTRHSHTLGFARLIALSFLLFLIVYLLLTATGTNSAAISIACPVVSAVMALASPRSTTAELEPASNAKASHVPTLAQMPDSSTQAPSEPASPAVESSANAFPASSLTQPTPASTGPTLMPTESASASSRSALLDIEELPEGFAAAFDLSDREAELAAYAHRNYSARRIAGELFIAESTVYTHLKRIYRKTDVHSKHELIDLIDSWQSMQNDN